jgi:CrcB protein
MSPVPDPADATHREHSSPLPLVLVAVFAAGGVGTAARLGLDLVFPPASGGLPVSTLVLNAVGSFALGAVAAALPRTAPEWLRAAVTTGLLGSFTTFSALTLASVQLAGSGDAVGVAVLLVASVLAGVAGAAGGLAVGGALSRRLG